MIGDPRRTRTWRPQRFGKRSARSIDDPLIEPVWTGIRVLGHVTVGEARFIDEHGEEPAGIAKSTLDAFGRAILATEAIVEGYLTTQVPSGIGVFSGSQVESPTAGDLARQMLIGGGRGRREDVPDVFIDQPTGSIDPETEAVFVAVDLIMLDGQSLLDIPLLERKRLLDSVVDEGRLTRLGIHVRPPIGPWLGTWKAAGFRSLAWKHANSRYRPGEPNEDWAISGIPER